MLLFNSFNQLFHSCWYRAPLRFGYKLRLHPILLKCDAIIATTASNCTLNQLTPPFFLFLSVALIHNGFCTVWCFFCTVKFSLLFLCSRFARHPSSMETLTQIWLSARSNDTTTKFNVISCDWHSSWHNFVYTINLLSLPCLNAFYVFVVDFVDAHCCCCWCCCSLRILPI